MHAYSILYVHIHTYTYMHVCMCIFVYMHIQYIYTHTHIYGVLRWARTRTQDSKTCLRDHIKKEILRRIPYQAPQYKPPSFLENMVNFFICSLGPLFTKWRSLVKCWALIWVEVHRSDVTSPVTSSRPKTVVRLNLAKRQCPQVPHHQRNKQERCVAPTLEHADRDHPSFLPLGISGKLRKRNSKSFELRNDLALSKMYRWKTSIQRCYWS